MSAFGSGSGQVPDSLDPVKWTGTNWLSTFEKNGAGSDSSNAGSLSDSP